jgi:hypothetical protein
MVSVFRGGLMVSVIRGGLMVSVIDLLRSKLVIVILTPIQQFFSYIIFNEMMMRSALY